MYLISAYFDEKTNKVLSGYINGIAKASGNSFMIDNNVLPHITFGKTLDDRQMREAFIYMQKTFAPLEGQIVKLGVAKTNPHRDIFIQKL